MKTTATFLGHPIHQMVIVLPLGLLATAATFEIAGTASGNKHLLRTSHTMTSAGLATAVASAVPGAIDFWNIPSDTRAKKIGLLHGVGNLVCLQPHGRSVVETRGDRIVARFRFQRLEHCWRSLLGGWAENSWTAWESECTRART